MLIYLLTCISLINTFHGVTVGQPYGETRMDYDKNYVPYQDIIKAFSTSNKQWLYGANFPILQEYPGYSCVNFRKDGVSQETLNFTAHYLKDTKPGSTQLYGKLSVVNNGADHEATNARKNPNCIEVSSTPGSPTGTKLNLIYSNYKNCSILRVPSQESGSGCIVLLTVAVVRSGLPFYCNTTYHNACGKQRTFHKLFSDDCALTTNPPGC